MSWQKFLEGSWRRARIHFSVSEISWRFLAAGTDSFLGVRNFLGVLGGGHGFIFGCQKFLGVFDGGHGFIFWSQKFLSCSWGCTEVVEKAEPTGFLQYFIFFKKVSSNQATKGWCRWEIVKVARKGAECRRIEADTRWGTRWSAEQGPPRITVACARTGCRGAGGSANRASSAWREFPTRPWTLQNRPDRMPPRRRTRCSARRPSVTASDVARWRSEGDSESQAAGSRSWHILATRSNVCFRTTNKFDQIWLT